MSVDTPSKKLSRNLDSLSSSKEGPGAGAVGDGKGKFVLWSSKESIGELINANLSHEQCSIQPNGISRFGGFDEPILGR